MLIRQINWIIQCHCHWCVFIKISIQLKINLPSLIFYQLKCIQMITFKITLVQNVWLYLYFSTWSKRLMIVVNRKYLKTNFHFHILQKGSNFTTSYHQTDFISICRQYWKIRPGMKSVSRDDKERILNCQNVSKSKWK